jgi:hypothetical protein
MRKEMLSSYWMIFKETRAYCKLKEEALVHTLKNLLWKRLQTHHTTDYRK